MTWNIGVITSSDTLWISSHDVAFKRHVQSLWTSEVSWLWASNGRSQNYEHAPRHWFSFAKSMKIDDFLALSSRAPVFKILSMSLMPRIFLCKVYANRWFPSSELPRPDFHILSRSLMGLIFLYKVYENQWVLASEPPRPDFNIPSMSLKALIFLYRVDEINWILGSGSRVPDFNILSMKRVIEHIAWRLT